MQPIKLIEWKSLHYFDPKNFWEMREFGYLPIPYCEKYERETGEIPVREQRLRIIAEGEIDSLNAGVGAGVHDFNDLSVRD